jgi:hypothetical protein
MAGERLAAMRSYLTARPDRFIGIKLAHAHQGVSFSDPVYQGVYQVAAETGAPVLLHTGFSPFPGTQDDPAYYDPLNLEAVVTAFDGALRRTWLAIHGPRGRPSRSCLARVAPSLREAVDITRTSTWMFLRT